MDGKTIAVKTFGRGGKKNEGRVVGPKWAFRQYGECGKWVSDLFPNLGTCVNDIAFLHSMYAESPIHGSAMLMMNSGRLLSGNPCLGTWVTYGLGSENENLPGFVVMLDPTGGPISGAKNWSSGYMPAAYQATVLRSNGTPIHDLASPAGSDRADPPAAAGPAPREERGAPRGPRRQLRAGRADRHLRAGLQDAALGARGGRPRRGIARDPGALRDRPAPDGRLRPQVPDRPAAGRARGPVRADLFRRRPQRRQLGRPRRPRRQPHQARRPHRPADRRLDQGPQASRACSTRP